MKKSKNILLLSLTLIMISLTSCQPSMVTDNGLFQKDYKILEESLIGQWALADNSSETEVIYEFLRNDSRKVKLFVRGQEIEMTEFRANGGGQFSFEYLENDSKVIVVAQFKSYDRQTLLCIQELIGAGESFKPIIVLDKVVVD